jgi:hypothetical protein
MCKEREEELKMKTFKSVLESKIGAAANNGEMLNDDGAKWSCAGKIGLVKRSPACAKNESYQGWERTAA